jgi:O-acetyl-ADP-ribose deacetylase (regulator of RNase III)
MKRTIGETVVEVAIRDITEMNTDAIVNAANSRLSHGGGVAAAISRRGGPTIQEESDLWVTVRGTVPAGSCAITGAGNLASRYVIHAVGPRMGEGDEDIKLRLATLSCLETAEKHNLKSIAFPAVSTGVFGMPMERCAAVMLGTVLEFVRSSRSIVRVVFCLVSRAALEVFEKRFKNLTAASEGDA